MSLAAALLILALIALFFIAGACTLAGCADDRCESAWEDDPYLEAQVRGALHPFDAEVMPVGDGEGRG